MISKQLLADVFVTWQLAGTLALARELKARKAKGRPPSDLVIQKWIAAKLGSAQSAVLLEAARATKLHAHNVERHVLYMLRYIEIERSKALRGRGRPRRMDAGTTGGTGMLNLSALQARTLPATETLLLRFYGMKMRIYARRKGLAESATLRDAFKVLERDPDIPRKERTSEGVTRALDSLVSDRCAANLPLAFDICGVSGATLAKRIQRVRHKFHSVLPMGGI
jgi:hypothetical protein